MDNIKWQLPISHSTVRRFEYISPMSKYHAFIDGVSLCKRFKRNKGPLFFSSYNLNDSMNVDRIRENNNIACKVCLNKSGI